MKIDRVQVGEVDILGAKVVFSEEAQIQGFEFLTSGNISKWEDRSWLCFIRSIKKDLCLRDKRQTENGIYEVSHKLGLWPRKHVWPVETPSLENFAVGTAALRDVCIMVPPDSGAGLLHTIS